MKSSDLNGISDISDVGDVDMFGLDAFGNPVGLGAAWGAMVGGGLGTVTSIGIRSMAASPGLYKWSEGIGFASGALAGGVMMAFDASRHSGLAAIATALATNGLRQIEALFGPSKGFAAYVDDPAVKKLLTDILTKQAAGAGTTTSLAPKAIVVDSLPPPAATPATVVTETAPTDGDVPPSTTGSDIQSDGKTIPDDETIPAPSDDPPAGGGMAGAVSLSGATRFSPTGVVRALGGATRFSRTGVVSGLNGTTVIEPTGVVQGAGRDRDGLPQLVGATSKTQKVNSATLLGVPGLNSPFSGLAGHFGSSIIG